MVNVSDGDGVLVSQVNTSPSTVHLWHESVRHRHTSNLAFDIDMEINSSSPNRESISMAGCVEEDRIRSHSVLKASGSMLSSHLQLSVLALELLRADVNCPTVDILLVQTMVTKRRCHLEAIFFRSFSSVKCVLLFHVQ